MTAPSENDGSPDVGIPSNTPKYSPVTLSSIHAAIGELGYSKEYIPVVSQALDELQLALSTAQGVAPSSLWSSRTKQNSSKYLHIDTHSEPKEGPTQALTDHSPGFGEMMLVSGSLVRTILDEFLCVVDPAWHHSLAEEPSMTQGTETGSGYARWPFGRLPSTDAFAEERLIPGINSLEKLYAVQAIVELAFYIYLTEPGFAGSLTTDLEPDVPRFSRPNCSLRRSCDERARPVPRASRQRLSLTPSKPYRSTKRIYLKLAKIYCA